MGGTDRSGNAITPGDTIRGPFEGTSRAAERPHDLPDAASSCRRRACVIPRVCITNTATIAGASFLGLTASVGSGDRSTCASSLSKNHS